MEYRHSRASLFTFLLQTTLATTRENEARS